MGKLSNQKMRDIIKYHNIESNDDLPMLDYVLLGYDAQICTEAVMNSVEADVLNYLMLNTEDSCRTWVTRRVYDAMTKREESL